MEKATEGCTHFYTYPTRISGLPGKYERCQHCLEYWHYCDNCMGVEPETCLFKPTTSIPNGPL